MKVLIFGENVQYLHDLAGFSQELRAEEVHAAALSLKEDELKEVAKLGIKKIYAFDGKTLSTDDVLENIYELVKEVNPDIIAGPATKDGNEISARLGARLGIPMITEVVSVEVNEGLVFRRASIGGRALSVESVKLPIALTISIGKFKPHEEGEASIETRPLKGAERVKVLEVLEKARGGIDIVASEIVIGVGRGFRSKDDLKLAEELANLLNGAVGCTRPIAADYGWLPEDVWIGLSGKKIRPKLYLALGISGAAQHIAGAIDSSVIVAVNTDENAPIFEQADYGVVADLYEFLPVLLKRIKEKLE